jgi:hypothetical protein
LAPWALKYNGSKAMEADTIRKGLGVAADLIGLVEQRDPKLFVQSLAAAAARMCDRLGIPREEFCTLIKDIPRNPENPTE